MPKTRFSEVEADRATSFFALDDLTHTKGRWAGQPLAPMPWQSTILREVFGRQVYDPELSMWVRQYRTVYQEIPRKNTKSTTGAGIGLKLTLADSEDGAEVYSIAEDLDQANIVFGMARGMIEASPVLSKRCKVYKRLIEVPKTGNIYRVLPADAPGAHGLSPHGVVFDEFHAQRDRELYDVMTSGQGARTQPLIWLLTTAGTDRESICWELHEYGEQVAAGLVDDPSFYYVRYGIEADQDWEDEDVWRRSNPALGQVITMGFLRAEYAKAKASPGRQNAFRNLYLNEWTQQQIRWLDLGVWDASAGVVIEPDLRGGRVYAALHLGPSRGMSSWVMILPHQGSFAVLPRFFLPEKALDEARLGEVYRGWANEGLIELTPGDVTDHGYIRDRILKDAAEFYVESISVNASYFGAQLVGELEELFGAERMESFRATFPGYALATSEMDRLLIDQRLNHGGNKVLRWMADNVVVRTNLDGDVKPDVEASPGSISGIVALLMALDRAAGDQGDAGEPQVAIFDG